MIILKGIWSLSPSPNYLLDLPIIRNQNATRSRGQLGPLLFENRDQQVLIADGMFKFAGWGLLVEYFERDSFNPITRNSQGQEIAVWIGKGANFQLSKMISRNSEFAIRYAYVNPDDLVSNLEKKGEETILGFTKYLNGHRIKIQANVGYAWRDGIFLLSNTNNFWTSTFQVEFGI